jgi:phosphoribosylformimino-5-aminoimidazole carboxamide ribotide isomerase
VYIYPAIDLYNGECVRLIKGDFNQKTVYSSQPVDMAKSFMAVGASKLHVVDLNGAESDNNANYEVVKRIVEEVDMAVQVGGGIRSLKSAEKYISIGVDRVIIGTKALEDPDFLTQLIKKFGDRLVVAVDGKDGFVAINGWKDQSKMPIMTFIGQLQEIGVKRILCTDISRDGLLQGSNIDLYKEIQRNYNMELIASGGVSSIEEIKTLREEGMFGAILGKALYEKKFTLEEALTC